MQKIVRTLLLSAFLPALLFLTAITPAQAAGGGLVSGMIFLDANRNHRAEPGEDAIAGVHMRLRAIADPTVIYTAESDASGNYLLRDLPYGEYEVWANAGAGQTSPVLTATLSEVNGAVALDLPVYDSSAHPDPTLALRIFLPTLLR